MSRELKYEKQLADATLKLEANIIAARIRIGGLIDMEKTHHDDWSFAACYMEIGIVMSEKYGIDRGSEWYKESHNFYRKFNEKQRSIISTLPHVTTDWTRKVSTLPEDEKDTMIEAAKSATPEFFKIRCSQRKKVQRTHESNASPDGPERQAIEFRLPPDPTQWESAAASLYSECRKGYITVQEIDDLIKAAKKLAGVGYNGFTTPH